MSRSIEKYQNLGIRESLSLSYRYPMACKELAVILCLGFSKSPKPLQSFLFEDTLFAFRLLSRMQTQSAISAANLLSQSAEAALPKQKRGLAATEYKQAKIAYKRRAKNQKDDKGKKWNGKEEARAIGEREEMQHVWGDLVQLPQDVLVHLFSFLDMQSLVTAGMVCRSWNAAANDNYLWQLHNSAHFGDSQSILKMEVLQGGTLDNKTSHTASNDVGKDANCDWKEAFKRAYSGLPSWRYKYNRGYCGHCNSIVWLHNLKCPNTHPRQGSENQQLKPLAPTQIVRYILNDTSCFLYSSDSDSESDEELVLKFWTYNYYY